MAGMKDIAAITTCVHICTTSNRHGHFPCRWDCRTKHRTIGTSVELISKVVVPDESIAMRVVGRTLAAEYREAHRRTDSTDRIQRQMAE